MLARRRSWAAISGGLALLLGLTLGSLRPVNGWAWLWPAFWRLTVSLALASAALVGYIVTSDGLLRFPAWRASCRASSAT